MASPHASDKICMKANKCLITSSSFVLSKNLERKYKMKKRLIKHLNSNLSANINSPEQNNSA